MTDDPDPLELCPRLQRAFALLGKRWTALILDVLSQRPARFSEVRRTVTGLSDRVLGERLQELVESGLVWRRAEAGGQVLYGLTPAGERLSPALDEIRAWAAELETTAAAGGRA